MPYQFDAAAFRVQFPQFRDETFFPPASLQAWNGMAQTAIVESSIVTGPAMGGYIDLMTAHLAAIFARIAAGGMSGAPVGQLSAATIDKVSVQYSVPAYKSGWQAWLSQTPYGEQLWALLSILSAGGWYINGMPETQAVRKFNGYF